MEGHDYSKSGFYFVTICPKDRKDCFGRIKDGRRILNQWDENIKEQWAWLSEQYPYVGLDEFKFMPNHFYGILSIGGNGRGRSLPQKIKSLSELIGGFKTTVSILLTFLQLTFILWKSLACRHLATRPGQAIRHFPEEKKGLILATALILEKKMPVIRRDGLSEVQWQKHFHDHTIRNEQDLSRLREYVKTTLCDGMRKWKAYDLRIIGRP